MGFWWFMLICDLLIPLSMIICGYFMWKYPSKKINGVAGYRTKRSMKNIDTWRFAQEYFGRLWWKIGWVILLISIIVFILLYENSYSRIGFVGGVLSIIQCITLIAPFFPTEKALKKHFMMMEVLGN